MSQHKREHARDAGENRRPERREASERGFGSSGKYAAPEREPRSGVLADLERGLDS